MTITSFADAEVGEDVGEDVGGGDVAGDCGEVVDGLAEVLGNEVCRKLGFKGGDGRCCRLGCKEQGLVVACVGHSHIRGGRVCVDGRKYYVICLHYLPISNRNRQINIAKPRQKQKNNLRGKILCLTFHGIKRGLLLNVQ